MSVIYSLKNVVKSRFVEGKGFRLEVPQIQICAEENIALVGHSGCGKSTLLDMLALALHPDSSDEFLLTPKDGDTHDVGLLWKKKKQNQF